MTNSILISTIIVLVNDYILRSTPGREAGVYTILTSMLGVFIAALMSYSWPIFNISRPRSIK